MIRIGEYGLKPDGNCWMLGKFYTYTDKEGVEREGVLVRHLWNTDAGACRRLAEALASPDGLRAIRLGERQLRHVLIKPHVPYVLC